MKKSHKICFVIASLLALGSLVIALLYWNVLPNRIPVHFGFDGQPNSWADKSLFYVFMLPAIEIVMTVMFIFLYYKPQYTNIPSTMWLMALEPKHRNHAFDLIRTMLVGTLLWVNVLMTYLTYGMNQAAISSDFNLSPWLMIIFIVAMLVWIIGWTIKVYTATKEAVELNKK